MDSPHQLDDDADHLFITQAPEMMKRLQSGQWTLRDMREQFQAVLKMGPLGNILNQVGKMGPLGNILNQVGKMGPLGNILNQVGKMGPLGNIA